MKKTAFGFTLIELLVAISVIAILSVIGLASYSSVYKSSRDAKRKSDIRFIQSALEDYYADLAFYPSGSLPFGNSFTNCTGVYPSCVSFTKTYITTIPTDPSSPQYVYTALPLNCDNNTAGNGKCTGYCIYAKMEMTAPTSDVVCSTFPGGGYNYGITRP